MYTDKDVEPYVKRYTLTNNYHISQKEAVRLIENIKQDVSNCTGIPLHKIKIDKHFDGGTTYNQGERITIGTKYLYQNRKNGMVLDRNLVQTVIIPYHEQRHCMQFQLFQKSNVSDKIKHMARIDLIKNAIPEYYREVYGYWNNINEIDAERYGVATTYALFKNNFPEIDIETELVNLVKLSQRWYANTHVNSYDDIIRNLDQAEEASYDAYVHLKYNPYILNYSRNFKAFYNDKTTYQQYLALSSDGAAANRLLLDFIKQQEPWRFLNYPCLEDTEWTPEVRQSKKPFIRNFINREVDEVQPDPQSVHEERLRDVMNTYGHLIGQGQQYDDDYNLQ